MKFSTIIGTILIMNSVGEYGSYASIWLMILQAIVGFTLIAPAYAKILKEEIEDEKCN